MKIITRYGFLLLACGCAHATAGESHCTAQEQIIFSCAIAHSSEIASLCASQNMAEKRGSLVYRFGRRGQIELVFPAEQYSPERFRYAHYMRHQVDRTEISFSVGRLGYAVFDHYDGEEKPTRVQGVRVESPDGKDVELICAGKVVSQLSKLEKIIPCDTDNALANCN